MKTMKKFLSMAAFALVGAMMTGCSSDDDFQQPEYKSNLVTLKTTVGLAEGTTRALTAEGVKTFAEGETMAIIYKNTSGETAVAVSDALQGNGDITNEGKSATFTFTLDSPDKDKNVTYVYPAAMVNNDGTVKNDALASQDGTLSSLASNLDYCTNSGPWNEGNLPSLTLDNQFAICAYILKNSLGTDITSHITSLTVSDGTNNYAVSRSTGDGPIYVAIRPTTSANIEITASAASSAYETKSLTGKTYTAGTGYSIPLRLAGYDMSVGLSSAVTVPAGMRCTIAGSGSAAVTIGNGAEVTLNGATTSGAINCSGNATIVLADGTTNNLTAGIVPGGQNGSGAKLTIQGSTGVLNVSSSTGAAIGSNTSYGCGDIEIQGGVINASSSKGAAIGSGEFGAYCGSITINGGTITALSTEADCPAIGAAPYGGCGAITITADVTKVTATKGSGDTDCIGKSHAYGTGDCGTVTIGNTIGVVTTSPYTYDPNAPADDNTVTWGVSQFSGIFIQGDGSVVREGITLTVTDGYVINQEGTLQFNLWDPVKFSAPDGKIFTKIEITADNAPSGTDNGVWTGDAAEVQVGARFDLFTATSITFTLADPTLLEITVTDPYSTGTGAQKFYYFDGETFGQAITNHATENAAWQVVGTEVCYSNGYAIWCGSTRVSKDDVINASASYGF